MPEHVKLEDIPGKLGIQKGSHLFISSDIKRLFWEAVQNGEGAGPGRFIDGFKKTVGEEGTLAFPTYNWDFCSGKAFDYRKTKCRTGALGAAALKRKDFVRTRHPIYSFAVWGKYAGELAAMENTDSFGEDSPFAFFREKRFINIIADVTYQRCFTYVHYVEERTGAPYRYIKEFTAPYIDGEGREDLRTYSMFVRDLGMDVRVTIDPMEEVFLREGVERTEVVNGVLFRILDLWRADPFIEEDVRENKSRRLCTYAGQEEGGSGALEIMKSKTLTTEDKL